MIKNDARKLDRKSQETLRIRGVQAILSGESPKRVAEFLDVNLDTVYNWAGKYAYGGWDALKRKKSPGRPPIVQKKYLKLIYKIVSQSPQQLKFPFALWTRKRIQKVIKSKYDIDISITTVGRLMTRLGLTCQKPLRKAYEKNPSLVKKWRKEEYPRIRRLAKKEQAQIYFGDESGLRSDYHSGTTWSIKGKTPEVKGTGRRFSLNMISAISSKGGLRFMTAGGSITGDVFIAFLKRLIIDVKKPVYLIVDGHPTHRSKKVREFVDSTEGFLKLFYLPPYSPDLNPDELVWNHLKYHCIGKLFIRTKEELQEKVTYYLKSLQRKPYIIRNFFLKPSLKYAI